MPKNKKEITKRAQQMNKKELLSKVWQHLLSIKKGFAFTNQSKRIYVNCRNFYNLDLEMYNIDLKCIVLINLHTGNLKSEELTKMQKLVEHYNRNVAYSHENPTIGILINNYRNRCHITYVGIPDQQKKVVEKTLLLDEFDNDN